MNRVVGRAALHAAESGGHGHPSPIIESQAPLQSFSSFPAGSGRRRLLALTRKFGAESLAASDSEPESEQRGSLNYSLASEAA